MQSSAIDKANLAKVFVEEQVLNEQVEDEIFKEEVLDREYEKRIRQEAHAAEGAGQNVDAEV